MTRDIAPFGLRIPEDLKMRISQDASDNKRSMNSEMIARLIESFEPVKRLDSYTDAELIAELLLRYKQGEIYIRIGKCGTEKL